MTAGNGSDAFKASQLEALMVKMFGPDFRDLTVIGPLGTFHLESAFEECGLQGPHRPPSGGYAGAYGLWQVMPSALVLNETCAKRGGKCDCAEGACKLDEA